MRKKLYPSSTPVPRKHRGKGRKGIGLAISLDGELPVWPTLGQLRAGLRCRVRGQPECPYRFDESL